jgi:hypothetical protein
LIGNHLIGNHLIGNHLIGNHLIFIYVFLFATWKNYLRKDDEKMPKKKYNKESLANGDSYFNRDNEMMRTNLEGIDEDLGDYLPNMSLLNQPKSTVESKD